jgi:hypothetical protein
VDGTVGWLRTDDANGVLAYERRLGREHAVVAFNASDVPRKLSLPVDGRYRQAYPAGMATAPQDTLHITLEPRRAAVFVRD